MKKLLALALFASSFLFFTPTFAATSCLDTGCSPDQVCKGDPPTCQASSIPNSSGSCTVDAGCVNYGPGYHCSGGTCVAPTQGSSGATTPPATGGGGYVPLAPIPGLTQGATADSNGIATFLNNLYKFLIGIAVIIAVIQIVRGGLYIMGESVTKHGEGKDIIYQSLMGLVLILAPVLVFTIINPAILNLNLNIQPLNVNQYTGGSTSAPAAPNQQVSNDSSIINNTSVGVTTCSDSTAASCSAAVAACNQKSGFGQQSAYDYTCIRRADSTQQVQGDLKGTGTDSSCPSNDYEAITCSQTQQNSGKI